MEKRPQWRASQEHIDPAKVVFIDETWAKTNMTRRYGGSALGTRLAEKAPCGRRETATFLGALRAEGFFATLTAEGPINGPLFPAWVEQYLAPVLHPGDMVVMDNLSSHKVAGIREAIEAVVLSCANVTTLTVPVPELRRTITATIEPSARARGSAGS